jgi:hypothetical protein
MSRNSVKRAIKLLVKRKLIKVLNQFKNGEPTSNLYTLLGGAPVSLPRATQALPVGPHRATKHKVFETINEDKTDANKLAVKTPEAVSRNKPQRQKCDALKYMDRIIEKNKNVAPIGSILDIAGLGRGNGH